MSSAISKQQPMRPALGEVIDSCNATETILDSVVQLVDELEAEKHFFLYDFAEEYDSKTILPISDTTPITGSNRFNVTIPENLQADWKVASLLKWELFNGNTRVDGVLCYQFTMGGQTQLAAAFKTSGNASASITKFSGEILLLKREEI